MLTLKIASWQYAAVTIVLAFFSLDDIGITHNFQKFYVLVAIIIISIVLAIILTRLRHRNCIWREETASINLIYGDLMKISFNADKTVPRIVVIPLNSHYDTIVDSELVASPSIHGQWINQMCKNGETYESINKKIQQAIIKQGMRPTRNDKLKPGNKAAYTRGSIVKLEQDSTMFFLLALSEFDNNLNAQCSKDQLVDSIRDLINFYDKNGQGYPIYIPLLGTELSRVNITEQESMMLLSHLFMLYKEKIHGKVNIVVYENHRCQVPIFN